MLGIDRRVLGAAWTLFLFALVLAALYRIGHTLLIFALALFLAYLLSPAVALVDRFFPRNVSPTVSLAIVYLALVGILVGASISIGSKIAEQAVGLATKLPDAIKEDPLARLPLPRALEPARERVNQAVRSRMEELNKNVLPMLTGAGKEILSGIGALLSMILIPILSFFFLKDGEMMRQGILDMFDGNIRIMVDDIFTDLDVVLAQYIRALVFLSIASFLAHFAFLSVVNAPYAILLAGIAAALEFIPVVGPLTAATVILLVSAFSGYHHILWLVIFLALFRIFQDYVLNPYLMSAGVEVHPVLVLFGVIAGEQLAGIPGMFFSVPTIAALRVVVNRVRKRRRGSVG